MSENTNLMSKNIVTKPVAKNSIEVWVAMSKDNFLRKWYLRSILSIINWITKRQKTKKNHKNEF